MPRTALAPCLLLCLALPAHAAEFTVLAWNVESDFPGATDPHDGNDPAVIAQQLEELASDLDAGIVGLVEVRPANFIRYRNAVQDAHGGNVDFVTSASGDHDSTMLVIDADRFEFVSAFELHRYGGFVGNANNLSSGLLRSRSPLVVRIRHNDSGTELFVFVVHLARGAEDLRKQQAEMLREWAADQTLPSSPTRPGTTRSMRSWRAACGSG